MQRVMVIGSGGAGKSTFARELGRRTGLPVIHLDRHHWGPNWTAAPSDQWRKIVTALAAMDRWIIDGNYSATLDIRLQHADTVILLGFPRWRCLLRVLRRWWTNRGQSVQAAGCPERLDWRFLRWVWRYPIDSRPHIDAGLAQSSDAIRVVELVSSAAVTAFVNKMDMQLKSRGDSAHQNGRKPWNWVQLRVSDRFSSSQLPSQTAVCPARDVHGGDTAGDYRSTESNG